MNKKKLEQLVAEAIVLDRQIQEMTAELKAKKATLVDLAESGAFDRTDTDGGGWSCVFADMDGNIARVTQPAPKLKSSIDAEKPAGARLMEMVGKLKDELFAPRLTYIPVENFRERVATFFGKNAGKVLKACETPNSPTVSFETKEVES